MAANDLNKEKKLTQEEEDELICTLKSRFEENMNRHKDISWDNVEARLKESPDKLWSLYQMEITGGEPDVVDYDKDTGEYIFYDCCRETPIGRRNICYDPEALASRKKNKPPNSAIGMATDMGIEILTEEEYRYLQSLDSFDLKTSSWIKTPDRIRKLGGALFCDRRYDTIFLYHNGAESYYSVRGFRGLLRV